MTKSGASRAVQSVPPQPGPAPPPTNSNPVIGANSNAVAQPNAAVPRPRSGPHADGGHRGSPSAAAAAPATAAVSGHPRGQPSITAPPASAAEPAAGAGQQAQQTASQGAGRRERSQAAPSQAAPAPTPTGAPLSAAVHENAENATAGKPLLLSLGIYPLEPRFCAASLSNASHPFLLFRAPCRGKVYPFARGFYSDRLMLNAK